MKRLLAITVIIAMALILPALSHAAGSMTQTFSRTANSNVATLTLAWTADSSGNLSVSTTAATTAAIEGYYLSEVRTVPGGTTPTNLYDVSMNDTLGIDMMGGALADRSSTLAQSAIPVMITGIYGSRAIDGALTVVITGNSVNAATGTIKLFLTR